MSQSKLELAVENNDVTSLQAVVQSCKDINEQNAEGNTALHVAISEGCDYDILKLLLSNGASVAIKNKEGHSPLQLIDPGSCDTFLNLFKLENFIDYSGGVGNTIMHFLMMTDSADLQLWNTILEGFPNLHKHFNARNVVGHTPLHITVCRVMSFEDIEFILNNFEGLNIFLADNKGNTFLHTYFYADAFNMVEEEFHTLFLTRLFVGEFKSCPTTDVSKLLCNKNNLGYTPLHQYVAESYEISCDILKLLIDAGSKIDTDVYGENVMHVLVRRFPENTKLIEFALANGGNANGRNGFGESPIFFTSDTDVVNVLLEADADLSVRNKVGKTVLMSMILRWPVNYKLIDMLITNGANVNEVDNHGNSVLHFAAWNDVNEDIIYLLVKNGANVVRDSMGYLPCQVAQKMGHISIINSICIRESNTDEHRHDLERHSFSKECIHIKELLEGALDDSFQTRIQLFDDMNISDILRVQGIGSAEFVSESKKVKDTVLAVIHNISAELCKHDPLLANTIIQSGSVGENTKVGFPDEFDFVCLIDILADICEIDEESTENDPGYVYVELKPEYRSVDKYRDLFNNHCYLETERLRQRFVAALTEIIQNPAVCSSENIVMELHHFKESQLAPNCQLTLRWTSCENKDIEINIDLVPACRIASWWPSNARLDVISDKREKVENEEAILFYARLDVNTDKREEVKKEGAVLLLQTTFDEDFEIVTKLRVSALSAEKIHMRSLPPYARDAYMVAKILIDDKVCPRVNLSSDRASFLRMHITSYMLKNCLFHVVEEDVNMLQRITLETNTEAKPSKILHDCVCKLFRKLLKCIQDETLPSFIFPWQDVFTFQDKLDAIVPEQNHVNCTCRAVYTTLILKLLGQDETFKDIDVDVLFSS